MNKKPNVIYILADDMGYGDISALNENSAFTTPNYDSLCKDGICFTDAHSTSAVCTPSRYGILTGRYNWRSKLKSNVLGGYSDHLIMPEIKTVATMLSDNGYHTACIGKWHLGMDFGKSEDFTEKKGFANCDGIDFTATIDNAPVDAGFDYFYGISASLDMPPYVYIENNKFTETPVNITRGEGKKFWREGVTGDNFVHEHVLDNCASKVLEKIDEYKEQPFFIYFPMNAPHTPILPAPEFIGKSGTNEYGDFVLHCDDILGRVVAKLKDNNILEDTIIIFTSDNGCSPTADFDELAQFGHNPNYVFRGHKADIYEGGHRIPYIIRWDNGIAPGQVCNHTVCLSDFMATMADIIGYNLADSEAVDSFSNLPLWSGEDTAVRSSTVHQSVDGSLAIRRGKWKLNMCKSSGGWPQTQREAEKLLPPDAPVFQLYDLENDIGETNNVILEHQDIFEDMRKELISAVLNGRTTSGTPQNNEGSPHWETAKFLLG